MEAERCPKCDAATVIDGLMRNEMNSQGMPHSTFRFDPAGRRWFWLWPRALRPAEAFRCCLSCGHLWSSLDPIQVRSYIKKYGTSRAKWHLEPFEKPAADHELA